MAFKPIDPKRDAFRKYMEKSGVIEAYTKTFVKLLREPSTNPLQFTIENLSYTIVQEDIIKSLQADICKTKKAVKTLNEMIENEKKKLARA